MDPTTLAFDQQRLDPNAIPIVAYLLETSMGPRIWTRGVIPSAIANTEGAYYDAEVPFDADVYFDGGIAALEVLPRVVDFSPLAQRTVPIGTDLLIAMGEAERASFSVSLVNDDSKLSQMLAEEYVLNRLGKVLVGYIGLAITDYIEKYRGRVQRWRIQGTRRVVLEHLES